jgi:hypothetical protein
MAIRQNEQVTRSTDNSNYYGYTAITSFELARNVSKHQFVCSLIVSNQSFICPDFMKLFDIGSWAYKQTER